MAEPAFDPEAAVRFDLSRGATADAGGARLVLVPASALGALDAASLAAIGEGLGRACGERVASRLGGDGGVLASTVETVVSHLAGELAVAGVGAMHVERWGRALVVVLEGAAIDREAFISALLGAAMSSATGREVSAARLSSDGDTARYFLGSAATAERVRARVAVGASGAAILAELQGGSS